MPPDAMAPIASSGLASASLRFALMVVSGAGVVSLPFGRRQGNS